MQLNTNYNILKKTLYFLFLYITPMQHISIAGCKFEGKTGCTQNRLGGVL